MTSTSSTSTPPTHRGRTPFLKRHGRLLTVGAALGITAGLLSGLSGTSTPSALTPPLSMTADPLPTWQTNGIVYALAEADGQVFVGGTFSTIRPPGAAAGSQEQPAINFAAFDAATGEPTDCSLSFTIGSGTATVRALAVSPDEETLYVGGSFGTAGGSGASSLIAVDIDSCTRDTSFSPAANGMVRALAATGDRVYAGGEFSRMNGEPRARFAALDHDGDTVAGWRADTDEIGKAVDVTPDGQHVLLGGDFFTVNGENSHGMAVVSASSGAVERAYPTGFIPTSSTIQDIATDANGFYVGAEGSGGGVFDGRIALDLTTFDEKWRDTCLGATQAVLPHDEVLYSGHHAHDCSSMGAFPNQPRYHLFAQSVHDPTLLGWFPNTNDGLGEQLGPRVMTVSEDVPGQEQDYLWVGGGFTTVEGRTQWGLTRFATAPDTGNPTAPEAHAASLADGEITVSWRASLDLDDSALTYRVYRDGANQPVHTVTGDSVPWQRPQLTFTDTDVAAGSSHSYRVTATDGAGNVSALSPPVTATAGAAQPYVTQVLADEPLLYWRFDETAGNFASDASGNGNSGVHRGGPQRGVTPGGVPGPQAAALGYDGTDAYTYSDDTFSDMRRFTLETWLNTTTTSGGKLIGLGERILEPSRNSDNNLYMLNDGRVRFGIYDRGSYRLVTSEESLNDGAWHHVAASVGSRGIELYVDGERVATNDRLDEARDLSNYYWHTGGDGLSRWPLRPNSDYFDGRMDETAIYSGQLPADRIAAHVAAADAPVDTVTRVEPSADTYVNGAATSANYGGHQQLAVRGSSAYESYLRFDDLPQAPEGTVLKDAALQLRVTTESHAGSEDTFTVVPITGEWTESDTTYATRPSLGDTELGTLTQPSSPGGVHTVGLTLSAVQDALGASLELALVSEGTDSLWLSAREAGQSGFRPQLLLTFGAP